MSQAVWLPALVVLLSGLALGILLAFRLRGTGAGQATQTDSDLDLKIRDLEERRDDLYRRLRAADEDRLGSEERSALEEAAALTLRDLDHLRQRHPGPLEKAGETSTHDSVQEAPGRRRPLLTGVALGAAMMLVIALLIYWAVRDARPTAQQPMQAGTSMEPPHEGTLPIPPQLAAQITDLQNKLAAQPEDWAARKELALTYVASGQFVEAFSEASQILQQFPEDPDGLLVHGIVRLTMGQAEQAVGLLDRVLAQHPDHRQALVYRGLSLYQLGNVEQAMDTWEIGLEMAGGKDPELQDLIQMARSGGSQPAGMTPPSAAQQELSPDGFSLHIEIADGVELAPQATLIIYLRPAEGGPPVAARRIPLPRFPILITLGVEDSMMGDALPDSGILVARLDADGSVSTADPSDLQIETPADKGQLIRLVLGR